MSESVYVLDASALLALMLDEPGSHAVHAALPTAKISAVNLSEVVAKLHERDVPDDIIEQSLADLDLTVMSFDLDQAMRAGKLRRATRSAGLSFGDRACLGLAAAIGATAITTDRAWARVETEAIVEIAR